jgi:hypothetical protein
MPRLTPRFLHTLACCLWIALALGACDQARTPEPPSQAIIEVGAGPDLFPEMDGGLHLTVDEIKGRNAWYLWTAGNDAFWDEMARKSGGLVDLLKTLDSHKRASRFREFGLINEPGYRQANAAGQFGLWLDEPTVDSSPTVDPQIYGCSTEVLGFRLFPNPAFTGQAVVDWNADLFYNDPKYAANPNLVRPYRVGVSCAACHVAPNPLVPPIASPSCGLRP